MVTRATEGCHQDIKTVVHCVRVSLTSTIVALSWAHWSVVGDWFWTLNTHSVTLSVGMGAPLIVVVMGPRPGNVAKGI